MTTRKRSTWKPRVASPPPAVPGYEGYFQDDPHPAAYPDPDADDYNIGNASDFNEDVDPGPYSKPGRPAVPMGEEDHPALRTASREVKAQYKKAMKAIFLAEHLLGANASKDKIKRRAKSLMEMDIRDLDRSLDRVSNLAEEDWDDEEEDLTSSWDDDDDIFSEEDDWEEAETASWDEDLLAEDEELEDDHSANDEIEELREEVASFRGLMAQMQRTMQASVKELRSLKGLIASARLAAEEEAEEVEEEKETEEEEKETEASKKANRQRSARRSRKAEEEDADEDAEEEDDSEEDDDSEEEEKAEASKKAAKKALKNVKPKRKVAAEEEDAEEDEADDSEEEEKTEASKKAAKSSKKALKPRRASEEEEEEEDAEEDAEEEKDAEASKKAARKAKQQRAIQEAIKASKAVDACGADYLDEEYAGEEEDDLFDDGLPDPADYMDDVYPEDEEDSAEFFTGGPDPFSGLSGDEFASDEDDDELYAEWFGGAPQDDFSQLANRQARTASRKGSQPRPQPRTQPNGANNLKPIRTAGVKGHRKEDDLFESMPVVKDFF